MRLENGRKCQRDIKHKGNIANGWTGKKGIVKSGFGSSGL